MDEPGKPPDDDRGRRVAVNVIAAVVFLAVFAFVALCLGSGVGQTGSRGSDGMILLVTAVAAAFPSLAIRAILNSRWPRR